MRDGGNWWGESPTEGAGKQEMETQHHVIAIIWSQVHERGAQNYP